jgi:hypothetical protein
VLEIEGIKKDTLHNIMMQQLYSLNYTWFQFEELIKSNYPEMLKSNGYYGLCSNFGAYEASRLYKALGLSGTHLDTLVEVLRKSHWAAFEDIGIEKEADNSFKMYTIDCSAQRAAEKYGLNCYECNVTGLSIRKGFFQKLNPNAKVQRIFAPPEKPPKGTPSSVSCKWLISV